MKRPTVIILIILLVLIIGLGVYEAHRGSTKTASVSSTKSSATTAAPQTKTSPTSSASASDNSFSPTATSGLAYSATINITAGDGSTSSATILTDGKGTIQYSTTQSGQSVQVTYTPSAYYTCTSGTCYKYPNNQGASTDFDPSSYAYTSTQLDAYRSTASYQGKKSCPAGTCDAWSVTSGSTTSTIFIDPATKHISEVKSSQANGQSSSISYDYKTVSITVPTNAQSITATPPQY